MSWALDTETGGTQRCICTLLLIVSCLCVGGTTLRKGPGPPLDRWMGTDVISLLLTVAVPQRTSEQKGEESWRILAPENARKTSHTLTDECVEPSALKGITPRMKPWQHIFCPSGEGWEKRRWIVPHERKKQTSWNEFALVLDEQAH